MALRAAAPRRPCVVSIARPQRRASRRSGNSIAPAIRLERAIRDLYGYRADRHRRTGGPGSITAPGACARRSARGSPAQLRDPAAYEFLPVQGEGLHQIPVGPVHAGIIEPGHFRFTANGETVARLEERLGYVHKGIDGLLTDVEIEQRGARGRPRLRRFHRGLQLRFRARRRGGARDRSAAARARCCAASWRSSSASPTISATSARSATTPRSR